MFFQLYKNNYPFYPWGKDYQKIFYTTAFYRFIIPRICQYWNILRCSYKNLPIYIETLVTSITSFCMYKLRYEFYNKTSHSHFQTKRLMTGRNILRLKKRKDRHVSNGRRQDKRPLTPSPLHQYQNSSYSFPYVSFVTNKENLFSDQSLLR